MLLRLAVFQFMGGVLGCCLLLYLFDHLPWYIIAVSLPLGSYGGTLIGTRLLTGNWNPFHGFNAMNNHAMNNHALELTRFPLPLLGKNAQRAEKAHITMIPEEMICPLSYDIMTDPVYFKGRPKIKFEKAWIEHALSLKNKDPFTNIPASSAQLTPDTTLQIKINTFLTQEENKHTAAATLIQAHYRGFFARQKLHATVENNTQVTEINLFL